MLEVIALRRIERPLPQVIQYTVKVNGFDRLTPRAARAALEIAFGNSTSGEVWDGGIGYRVYNKSARKVQR